MKRLSAWERISSDNPGHDPTYPMTPEEWESPTGSTGSVGMNIPAAFATELVEVFQIGGASGSSDPGPFKAVVPKQRTTAPLFSGTNPFTSFLDSRGRRFDI